MPCFHAPTQDEIAFCVKGPQKSEGLSEFMSQVVYAGEGVIQHRNAQVSTVHPVQERVAVLPTICFKEAP